MIRASWSVAIGLAEITSLERQKLDGLKTIGAVGGGLVVWLGLGLLTMKD